MMDNLVEDLQEIAECDDELTPYMIEKISKAVDRIKELEASTKELYEIHENKTDQLNDDNFALATELLNLRRDYAKADERIEELEHKNIHHTTRTQIANLTNHNIALTEQNKILDDGLDAVEMGWFGGASVVAKQARQAAQEVGDE